MVKLIEYPRTATFAWSHDKLPILATGTASGTVDADFSSASTLEFWSILSKDNSKPDAVINADAKFNDLDWSKDNEILAGALENGVVEFFNPVEKKSTAKIAKHSAGVRTVRFNSKQSNLLVSGGSQSEIFVWDVNKVSTQGYSPFGPGKAMTPVDEVQSLSWNQTLAHVFASAGSSGYVSIWDLKAKKEVIHLSYTSPTSGLKNQLSVVEWHPNNSTKVAAATGNDNEPTILVWDLRNANTPLQVLSQGHNKGILSLDWCHHDERLMLSSGRDNTCVLWNPEEGQKLTQYPTRGNWCFKTKFAPEAPELFASASFDNKIQIQTLQNLENKLDLDETAYKQQESEAEFWSNVSQNESNEKPTISKLQAPAWYGNRSAAAQWAFGGKLVSVTADGKGVSITTPSIEGFEKNTMLDAALESKDFVPIINKRLANTIDSTNEEDWSLLESLSMDGKVTYLSEAMSLDDKDEDDVESSQDQQGDFFNNLTAGFTPKGSFQLDLSKPNLTDNLLNGKLDKAVNATLKEGLLLESLVIALNSNDPTLKQRVNNAYFAKYAESSSLARTLYSIAEKNVEDLVDNVEVSQWKHIVKAINTYVDEEHKDELLVRLGDRLFENKQRQDALVLYLAGNSLDKVASIWLKELPALEHKLSSEKATLNEAHMKCLTEFVERFTVLSNYLNERPETKLTNNELISKFLEFVNMTASSGDFDLALKFLDNLPGDNPQVKTERQRVLIASGRFPQRKSNVGKPKYVASQQAMGAASASIGGPTSAKPFAERPPAFAPGVSNTLNSSFQPPIGRTNTFGAPSYPTGPVAPPNRYAPSSVSPSQNTPSNPPVQLATPGNPYAPPSNAVNSFSGNNNPYATPSMMSTPASPAATPYSASPYSKGYYNSNTPVPAVDPSSRVMSGQTPRLNKNANNGWNDLPEIIKEKTSRAKPVSTAPINSVTPANQLGVQPGSAAIPPPPLSRVTSTSSVPTGAPPLNRASSNPSTPSMPPPPPSKLSRGPSLAQPNVVLNEQPSINPYAPPQAKNPSFSTPSNPYAPPTSNVNPRSSPLPVASQAMSSPPTNPYAQQGPTVHAPSKAIPGPPPKAMARKTNVSGKDISSANDLLTSMQRGPNGAAAFSPQQQTAPPPVKKSVSPTSQVTPETFETPSAYKPIVDFLSEELARVTPLVPAEFGKQLKDCNKRLKILFNHLEKQDLLTQPTVDKLHHLVNLLKEHKYSEASAVHVDIATNHAQEAGNWLTGVKRLIGLAEATSN
ncbi:HCL072Wp [Eremothecium sinecaudum]|uniref:Protein transport protein SEC31 n=1 Tax=Eremothecium sinecaudum TaxID=45286 RepID=A0A0X8HRG3_9SACH|nr:HCL072Wp [Eremothecium sinecaudum]AMD20079.1 HCL072Wp [Eremothecium sinecaudum]